MKRAEPITKSWVWLCATAYVGLLSCLVACGQEAAKEGALQSGRAPRISTYPRHALVVGTNDIAGGAAAKLQFAESDANDVGDALEKLGWEVRRMTGASVVTRENVEAEVRRLGERTHDGGALLFFCSGHGFSVGSSTYIVAGNSTPGTLDSLIETSISVDVIANQMMQSEASVKLIVLDVNRNEVNGKSLDLVLQEERFPQLVAQWYSTGLGGMSYEPLPDDKDRTGEAIRNGIFSHCLLVGMREVPVRSDGALMFRDLVDRVSEEVSVLSADRPTSIMRPYLKFEGYVGGDFVFGYRR